MTTTNQSWETTVYEKRALRPMYTTMSGEVEHVEAADYR